IAVNYNVVDGGAGLQGIWDIGANKVKALGSATELTIGTTTGLATNLRFPGGTNYINYRVTTAHNGLLLNDEVRQTINASGITWTRIDGTALPGATPLTANLVRTGGSIIESIEFNAGVITANTQRITLATDDPLNTEIISKNAILYDDGATLGIKGWRLISRNRATGTRTITNLLDDYSAAIPVSATNIRETSATNSSGGGIAVYYDVVGGSFNLEGAWDVANSRVYPKGSGAALTVGTATGNARNLSFAENTEFVDYTVNTAHNGLAVNDQVRKKVTPLGDTWAKLDGTALPGANPVVANLTQTNPAIASSSTRTPLTAIANSSITIEVPEPGDTAVAGSATIPFRPAPGALAISATPGDLNGIPTTATAVSITVWPSVLTRDDLGNRNQAYLAGLSLIYTIDGTDPDWGTANLTPNGHPMGYGGHLILSRADALNLRVLANSDTNTANPVSPGRPQLNIYGLIGTEPEYPIYQSYDWALVSGLSSGNNLSAQLPVSLGAKAGAQSLSIVPATDSISPPKAAYQSTVTGTRDANTTAYLANDVYGPLFQLQNIGPSGGHIILNSIDIIFNLNAVPSGMRNFVLYLYDAIPASGFTDNAPFSVPAGDRASLLTPSGISLGSATLSRGGGSVVLEIISIDLQAKLATGQTSLWGYLVTENAFTPDANSESYSLRAKSLSV
ncbi:MAG: hypothetical protein ACRC62_33520, partial [Microcoleus sp.]